MVGLRGVRTNVHVIDRAARILKPIPPIPPPRPGACPRPSARVLSAVSVPTPEYLMGFHQTPSHKNGKASYHQIGLVRGQFGNVPEAQWLKFIQDVGFDGWEEASWELDLRKCDTDAGAAAYAKERVELARKHGLEIFTVATHLQGQVLGDEPSAKTLNFCSGKGEAKAAYEAWRAAGNNPP